MKTGKLIIVACLVLVLAWMTLGRSSGYDQGSTWKTLHRTNCYDSNYDIGYQGNMTDLEAQNACAAIPGCKGAARHPGGDWWLLSNVSTQNKSTRGNRCIIKP